MQQDSATTRSIEGKDGPAITVGLDVGDRYTHVHALGAGGEVIRERRRPHRGGGAGRSADRRPAGEVVLEAGPRSPWLSRVVAELGHEVVVANPRQVALIAGSQRDRRLDAAWLARLDAPHGVEPRSGAESAQSRRGARPRRAVRSRTYAHRPRARGRQGLRRRLPSCTAAPFTQDGGAHSRRAAPGAAAAGGGDWRADRAHRGGRAGGRGVVRGPPRDRGAAPGHRRGADHRAHVRADDRGTRGASRSREVGAYLGLVPRQRDSGERGRSSASARAATRACGGCWCGRALHPRSASDPIGPAVAALRGNRGGQREEARGRGRSRGGWRCCCSRCGRAGRSTSRCVTPWPARPRSGEVPPQAAGTGDQEGRPERERSHARDARLRAPTCPIEAAEIAAPSGSRMCLHAPGSRSPPRVGAAWHRRPRPSSRAA